MVRNAGSRSCQKLLRTHRLIVRLKRRDAEIEIPSLPKTIVDIHAQRGLKENVAYMKVCDLADIPISSLPKTIVYVRAQHRLEENGAQIWVRCLHTYHCIRTGSAYTQREDCRNSDHELTKIDCISGLSMD